MEVLLESRVLGGFLMFFGVSIAIWIPLKLKWIWGSTFAAAQRSTAVHGDVFMICADQRSQCYFKLVHLIFLQRETNIFFRVPSGELR